LDLFILFSFPLPLPPLLFSLFCQVTLCSEALVRGKNLIRKLDGKRSSVKTSSRIARSEADLFDENGKTRWIYGGREKRRYRKQSHMRANNVLNA